MAYALAAYDATPARPALHRGHAGIDAGSYQPDHPDLHMGQGVSYRSCGCVRRTPAAHESRGLLDRGTSH
jgi:hypothetical protein